MQNGGGGEAKAILCGLAAKPILPRRDAGPGWPALDVRIKCSVERMSETTVKPEIAS